MVYDEKLAARVRKTLSKRKGITEKEMFGGIAFMLRGKMCVGVVKNDLMVRVGPENHDRAVAKRHARPMDFTGRPMKGFLFVGPGGVKTEKVLAEWVNLAADFAATLKR